MRYLLYILLFQCLFVSLVNEPAIGQVTGKSVKKALQIVKKNAVLLDSISQLLVVFNETPDQNSAVLVAMEKKIRNGV